MYVYRTLTVQPLRLILTLNGIALCIILILFILGIYNGVAVGSIDYIKRSNADIWVLHSNSTNIMRGTSVLANSYQDVLGKDSLIKSISPVLAFLTNINAGNENATVLLTGYIPGSLGGPPEITDGRNIINDNEIIIDGSFAKKYKLKLQDEVSVFSKKLKIVGLSSGTNAFVTQYAFVSLNFEQSIVDLPGIVSYFIIKANRADDIEIIKSNIKTNHPGKLSVLDQNEFLKNNVKEMEAGILPLFYAIAVIGSVVLAIILSLILSVNILERRKDFAIMKILGSSKLYLDGLIIIQALILSFSAELIGIILIYPVVKIIEYLSPEVSAKVTSEHIIYVSVILLFISIISSLLSSRRIRKIYPAEVFS